ncbi:MAG: mycolipenoyl-CoA---2-(long-chain-fatty acyl)-trehalose mycolipenoyltransferase [Solirubrobacteraceae bacterium]|nr:mycolipenoyl-CoA---2-(long-chain-fatty acyl)-trehalose mycolipenoyltransferase [Solirubrobacteraceae bacterium]
MQPISFLDFHPAPGLLVEWTVTPETASAARLAPIDPVPLSYNQELHLRSSLAAHDAGLPGNPWIATSFDIDGPADLQALGDAFTLWLRRHETTRSGFRTGDGGIERFTLPPEEVSLVQRAPSLFTSEEALHAYLDERFAAGTDPFAWPPIVLGVISRGTRSTVFVALDHVAGDGFSLALAVWELQTSYSAFLMGQRPELPETGSFLELCAVERSRGAAVVIDDPAVGTWREFVRACGGTTPTFPLDLGLGGQPWPQTVSNSQLLTPEEASAFEAVCTAAGGGLFAGLLTAMAISVHSITGEKDFRTVIPVHTRHEPQWQHAMGWFITCHPVDFSLAGDDNFVQVMERAQQSIRSAIRLARIPVLRILELLGDDFHVTRKDLFSMVSFTDYRKLPGGDQHAEWNAKTIGRVTEADDTHVWVSRQYDGVHLSVRHPDTPYAAEILDEYSRLIREVMTRVAHDGTYPGENPGRCARMINAAPNEPLGVVDCERLRSADLAAI